MTIPRDTLRKVALIVPRLGSNHDGEIIATARAIERTLAAEGRDWHWLAEVIRESSAAASQAIKPLRPQWSGPSAAPLNDWKSVVRFIEMYGIGRLSDRDADFIDSLARMRPERLTPRQAQWLGGIADRLGMRRSA